MKLREFNVLWVLVALVGVAAVPSGEGVHAEEVGPDSFTVHLAAIQDVKAVFATVETVDLTEARTRLGGTVAELAVDEGARVEEGQLLARVEDAKLALRLEALDAQIESLMAQRGLASTSLSRARQLKKSDTVSQARLDEVRTNLTVTESQLAATRKEREVVAEQRAEGAVYAPAAGRVLKVHVTRGAVVMPGENVATIAVKAFVLRMQVPERHARFLEAGQEVLVGGREGTTTKTGRIRQVYPELRQGRVVADVEVEGLGDFFVGERVTVRVPADERMAMVVPESFLFRRFGMVFARLESGEEVVVQPGRAREGRMEILSGLRAGDVLTRPEGGR